VKTALVTGASAGIGLAVARALAADGYHLTLVARDAERLTLAAKEVAADALVHAADLGEPGASTAAVDAHLARFGRLDVVVANAGTGTNGTAARTSPDSLTAMTRLNVDGLFELAGAAVPALRGDPTGDRAPGWFVVVASLAGTWPARGFAAYSATKAAAVSLARSIAIEEGGAGVRACAICPAFVDTELSAWAHDRVPPETMLDASDVAEAVRFLTRLSPNASVTELVLRRAGAAPFEP
jgi:NADP-dependent 3-hydroxy acid dehydrogenase YdfG